MPRFSGRQLNRLTKGGAGAAACCALAFGFIGSKEGLRTKSYPDSIGVWTACIGETRGIRKGMRFTRAQCEDMFKARTAQDFAPALERCLPDAADETKVSNQTYVAFLSMSYNLGSGGFCRSHVVALWNDGDHAGACHAMLRYDRAGGRVLRGLTLRREDEAALCMKGLAEVPRR